MEWANDFFSCVALALALSIDSFAVAAGALSGVSSGPTRRLFFWRTALLFAGVQTLLFLGGYALGFSSLTFLAKIDHWLAALILLYLAFNVWRSRHDALWTANSEKKDFGVGFITCFLSAFATSLDAFGAGAGSAFSHSQVSLQLFSIFFVTAAVVWGALLLGHKLSPRIRKKLPHLSTFVLLLLAVKIVLSHGHA